jgi:hypothetical protein
VDAYIRSPPAYIEECRGYAFVVRVLPSIYIVEYHQNSRRVEQAPTIFRVSAFTCPPSAVTD